MLTYIYERIIYPLISGAMFENPDPYMKLYFVYGLICTLAITALIMHSKDIARAIIKFVRSYMRYKRRLQIQARRKKAYARKLAAARNHEAANHEAKLVEIEQLVDSLKNA